MLRWRERAGERRIGCVGGLESAVGKISLVAKPVRPRLTVAHSPVERILRAQNIGAERMLARMKLAAVIGRVMLAPPI
jgi:hypothetical protein